MVKQGKRRKRVVQKPKRPLKLRGSVMVACESHKLSFLVRFKAPQLTLSTRAVHKLKRRGGSSVSPLLKDEMNRTLKYYICVLIEKLHRYVFDNIYVQDHTITVRDSLVILFYDLCIKLYSDYRRYLKKIDPIKYQRYTAYWK